MKTIAEQFYSEWMNDDSSPCLATKRAIERLEARIEAIEDWQSRPIEDAMQSQVDSLTAQLKETNPAYKNMMNKNDLLKAQLAEANEDAERLYRECPPSDMAGERARDLHRNRITRQNDEKVER